MKNTSLRSRTQTWTLSNLCSLPRSAPQCPISVNTSMLQFIRPPAISQMASSVAWQPWRRVIIFPKQMHCWQLAELHDSHKHCHDTPTLGQEAPLYLNKLNVKCQRQSANTERHLNYSLLILYCELMMNYFSSSIYNITCVCEYSGVKGVIRNTIKIFICWVYMIILNTNKLKSVHECVWERVSKCDRLVAADVINRDVQLANSNKESRGQAPRDYSKGSMENPGENTCTYWLTLIQEHPSTSICTLNIAVLNMLVHFFRPYETKKVPMKAPH